MFKALWIAIALLGSSLCMTAEVRNPDHVQIGIVPLDAQACGTPVLAYGKGGARETIRGLDHAHPTGVFFQEQSAAGIRAAVDVFERESTRISPFACRENACRFAPERFRAEFTASVNAALDRFKQSQTPDCDEGIV